MTHAAYRSAVAHPYFVQTYDGWPADPLTVGFQTEEEARAFASGRPEPLIDLVQRGRGVIAVRRTVRFPGASDFTPRDDFPQEA